MYACTDYLLLRVVRLVFQTFIVCFLFLSLFLLLIISSLHYTIGTKATQREISQIAQSMDRLPTVRDTSLKVELVFKGKMYPTNIAFLGPDDILVLEKNEGSVKRIVNGEMVQEPLLDV